MALSVPTPSGVLDGVALFGWDGTAWQPSGRAMPDVATPVGVLDGVAGFNWTGSAWAPTGVPAPSVATPSGVLDGVALYTWNGTAWTPVGSATSVATPTGVLRGVAAFSWDGANWQPAGQPVPDVPTPYGVLRGIAPYNWSGTAWVPGSVTGTTAETNLASLRIPANSMGRNGVIEVRCLWSYTNSSNNKVINVRFGASPGVAGALVSPNTAVTTTATAQSFVAVRNNNATNAQVAFGANQLTPFGSIAGANLPNVIDTTADSFININGTLALGTETLTLQRATAVVFYAP